MTNAKYYDIVIQTIIVVFAKTIKENFMRINFNGGYYDGALNANSYPHGYGVYSSPSGDKYDGYWQNGKQHGKGKMTYAFGGYYDGDWVNGMKQGRGTAVVPGGDKYSGDFYNGYMHGRGVLTFYDGARYEGGFSYGKMEGSGALYDRYGKLVFRGTFKNGEPVF